ncbi:MAG: hypothetical protein Kow0069_29180 [Promethearchaeota archaeon]
MAPNVVPAHAVTRWYARLPFEKAGKLAEIASTVADGLAGDGSVVIHCVHGVDRTGVVIALLLCLAGVEEDLIVADYAASGPGVEVSNLLSFLRSVGSLGGAEQYLREAGVPAGVLDRLVRALTRQP